MVNMVALIKGTTRQPRDMKHSEEQKGDQNKSTGQEMEPG